MDLRFTKGDRNLLESVIGSSEQVIGIVGMRNKGTGGLIGFNEIQFWGFTKASERVNTVRAALTAKVSSSPIWHPYEGATTADDVQTCSRSALATVTLPLESGTNYYFAETAHIIEDPDPNLVEWTSIEGSVERPRHR